EIYNFRTLRDELIREGARFTTTSDAEVLVAGFQAWGRKVFVRARGMWAAAFWEPDVQRLTLARDPLGKKPLVYFETSHGIAFASSVSALLALLGDSPAIDRQTIECYLGNLAVPYEHSTFVGVRKVPPGCFMVWRAGMAPQETRYWSAPCVARQSVSPLEASREVERLLRVAVRRRLEADVPLGVFLSAGYDSGIVAALAAEESGRSLLAVTAGTTGSKHDERGAAAQLARRYGLQHRCLEIPSTSAASLPFLVAENGEP